MKCCSARISVGAMNATWKPFSIATIAAISATIVLPEPTSPCSSRFIGCGRCMSSTISRDDLLLIARQLERQHAPRRFADRVGDRRPSAACAPRRRARLRSTRPSWNRKNSSKISRRCAGERKALRSSTARALRRKVDVVRARCADRSAAGAGGAPAAADRAARPAAAASAWCTSTRCILVVSVPVFS